jgi:hypothetical protein
MRYAIVVAAMAAACGGYLNEARWRGPLDHDSNMWIATSDNLNDQQTSGFGLPITTWTPVWNLTPVIVDYADVRARRERAHQVREQKQAEAAAWANETGANESTASR